jgi:hypothetical protein
MTRAKIILNLKFLCFCREKLRMIAKKALKNGKVVR